MELASRGQLRWAFLRVAVITVPLILLVGGLSGQVSGSGNGNDNLWYQALAKPELTPPGGTIGIVWSILYVLMGLAVAIVWHAKGNAFRRLGLILFTVQLLLNFAWSPLFFAAHQIVPAFFLILLILAAATATTFIFWKIRRSAALLMAPYLVWLCFAAYLNLAIWQLNPGGAEPAGAMPTNELEFQFAPPPGEE